MEIGVGWRLTARISLLLLGLAFDLATGGVLAAGAYLLANPAPTHASPGPAGTDGN